MADLNNTFTFDGVVSSSLGIYISGEGTFNAPTRRVTLQNIPGRNGALAIDEGAYENIDLVYPAFIFTESGVDFADAITAAKNAILSRNGYLRLSDTYHPDEYRLAIYKDGLEVAPVQINRAGEFSLVFNCKPQRFLTSGETAVSVANGATLVNPTRFEALPLIAVTGAGTITVNGYAVTVAAGTTGVTYIDCDIQDAYTLTNGEPVSRNGLITLGSNEFPRLSAGSNKVTISGLTAVKITPRWWRL